MVLFHTALLYHAAGMQIEEIFPERVLEKLDLKNNCVILLHNMFPVFYTENVFIQQSCCIIVQIGEKIYTRQTDI